MEFWDTVYYVHLYLTCMLDYVHNSHSFYNYFLKYGVQWAGYLMKYSVLKF